MPESGKSRRIVLRCLISDMWSRAALVAGGRETDQRRHERVVAMAISTVFFLSACQR